MKVSEVVIIEDNEEVREAFKLLLDTRENIKVIGDFSNCEDAIEFLKTNKPSIILMDIDLPGISGIEGTKIIKKLYPSINIIVITVFENSQTVFKALCSGATGYLTKNTDLNRLATAIDEVIQGGAPMSANIARMVVQSFQRSTESPLTDRETEILSQLATGKSYTNIGDTLFISKDTVKFHIKNIYIKLEVSNKADAIEKANREKLI